MPALFINEDLPKENQTNYELFQAVCITILKGRDFVSPSAVKFGIMAGGWS